MDRLACVNVISLPLQLLAHRHPDWVEDGPMVVVDRDEPNGTIEWVDKQARRARIRPGMRYAEGLSLRGDLRAGTVDASEVEGAVEELLGRLRDYSPFVEPSDDQPGVFWVDAAGLEGVFASLEGWAEAIERALRRDEAFYASVVVGFSRFGTYAVARSVRRVVVFDEAAAERRAAREVSLRRVGLEPGLCEELEKLGVETVGQFVRLPPTGVNRRFGRPAHRLHQMARGDLALPLQADLSEGPVQRTVRLDDTITVSTRLVFIIKRELNPLLARLAERQYKIAEVRIELHSGRGEPERLRVRPATPTVDTNRLLELVRLKLEDRTLDRGVEKVGLVIETRRSRGGQMQLFAETPPRDLEDANRALERLRAEFGREAVVCAVRRDGHLPEAQFGWEPFERLDAAQPPEIDPPGSLVRRIWQQPRPLRARQRHGQQIALPSGHGVLLGGPYVISGGWWVRTVHREYYFAERPDGQLIWLYWDGRRKQWFQQGRVE